MERGAESLSRERGAQGLAKEIGQLLIETEDASDELGKLLLANPGLARGIEAAGLDPGAQAEPVEPPPKRPRIVVGEARETLLRFLYDLRRVSARLPESTELAEYPALTKYLARTLNPLLERAEAVADALWYRFFEPEAGETPDPA